MQEKNKIMDNPEILYKSKNKKKNKKKQLKKIGISLFTIIIAFIFLLPLIYGFVTAIKTDAQMTEAGAPLWPSSALTYEHNGKKYNIYNVSINGMNEKLAIIKKGREKSSFIDPANPEKGLIEWDGKWRTLKPIWKSDPQWNNFILSWNAINFPRLLLNTILYALASTFGILISSSLVAYGFSRFQFPGKKIGFMILMATMILPPVVTLVPTYALFHKLGLVGTWWPLIIPSYFSNAFNVFLLRQFFMGIPKEMDDAAKIDGANPFRVFISIILPLAVPALVAVGLFHFFYCWNDFFGPLIYLAGKPELHPITVGLTMFSNLYTEKTNLIQAASLLSTIIPFIIFFLCQKFFMQGVVFTGVDK